MNEDIELYKMMRNGKKRINEKTHKMVDEFVKGFRPTKIALMSFLGKYSKPEVNSTKSFSKLLTNLLE